MTDLDPGHYRKMAGELLRDAIDVLRSDPPPPRRPRHLSTTEWRKKWTDWESERRRDLTFFLSPERSAKWCEAAGVDYDAVLSRLEAEDALYDPKDRFPVDLRGRSLIYPDSEKPTTKIHKPEPEPEPEPEDTTQRPCPDCGMKCKGYRALQIHKASCVGPGVVEHLIREYLDHDIRVTDITARHNVHPEMLYRLLRSHDVPRRQRKTA